MIQDLDKTIEKIIYERGRLSRSEIDISFEQPNGDWSSRINRPTINCWAFDLRENVNLRNIGMKADANLDTKRATIAFNQMRLDLTYLVTAWARKVEDEHQLLWRALGALAQVKQFDPDSGEGSVKDQPYKISILSANLPNSITSLSDLWSVLNNQMRLGFTTIFTVSLDQFKPFDTPLVLERTLRVGQASDTFGEQMGDLDIETVYTGEPKSGHGVNLRDYRIRRGGAISGSEARAKTNDVDVIANDIDGTDSTGEESPKPRRKK